MTGYVSLTLADLGVAALLIVFNGAISLAFRLGLEATLARSATRMVLQLCVIGYVLKLAFAQTSLAWTLALALIMIAVASTEVIARQSSPIAGWWSLGLGTSTLLLVGLFTTLFVVSGVIGSEPWYAPRVFLPILGMILGNALTGVSLALETLTQAVQADRNAIEARLALGARRLQALEGPLQRTLRTGLMPILNAMSVAGVVSLPGMMTGQILAGADPVEAAKYQIMIMFAIAGATASAVLLATLGGAWLLTDDRHRLRLDRLAVKGTARK